MTIKAFFFTFESHRPLYIRLASVIKKLASVTSRACCFRSSDSERFFIFSSICRHSKKFKGLQLRNMNRKFAHIRFTYIIYDISRLNKNTCKSNSFLNGKHKKGVWLLLIKKDIKVMPHQMLSYNLRI